MAASGLDYVAQLMERFGAVGEVASRLVLDVKEAGTRLSGAASNFAEKAGVSLAPLARVGAQVPDALQSILPAAGMVTNALTSVVSRITPFVEALNPSIVQAFNFAMRDLQAVIGQALLPVMELAVGVVRDMGAVLNPVMMQLAPVVKTVTDALGQVFGPVLDAIGKQAEATIPLMQGLADVIASLAPAFTAGIQMMMIPIQAMAPFLRIFASVMTSLAPVIKFFGEMLQTIIVPFTAFTALIAGAIEGFANFLGGLLGGGKTIRSAMDLVRDAMQYVAKSAILAAASLAKLFGFDTALASMIKALSPAERQDATGKAAMTNAAFTSLEAYAKQVSTSASISTSRGFGGTPEKSQQDVWMEGMVMGLRDIQANGMTMKELVAEIKRLVARAIEDIKEKLKQDTWSTADAAADKLTFGVAGRLGRWAGF